MAARPVSTSLGVLSSHVFSKSISRASRRFPTVALPRHQPPPAQPQTRALTCSAPSRDSNSPKNTNKDSKTRDSPAETASSDSTGETSGEPWYLQVEPPSQPPVHEPAPLPTIPPESPALLEPIVKYAYEEMGLDDLNLLDLREFDPPPALGQNLIMLFGTARSERHLHVASGRLVRWLRYNYKLEADADGLMGPGELKTKLRRLRRKAKLLGSNASSARGADDGLSTGWICVNLGIIGSESSEAARFDSSGQLSGFGNTAPETGSTVVIQAMTESRRAELNLETLWRDSLERNQRQRKTFSSAPPKEYKARHVSQAGAGSSPRSQPLAGHGQKRSYTTSRISASESTTAANDVQSPLYAARRRMLQLRSTNADISHELDAVLSAIFPPNLDESHAADQVALADDLMRMLSRQNRPAIAQNTLISLIGAIARSRSESPILARAQANLETLMTVKQFPCPSEADLIRLLEPYSIQGNWVRFWETWRLPPRFGHARSEDLYAAMFEFVASSRDVTACVDAVRNCTPSMQFEDPPVLPVDRIYNAVIACLAVADPGAVQMADSVASGEAAFEFASRRTGADLESQMHWAKTFFERKRDREFVQVVHDLRFARRRMEAARTGHWPDI